MRVGVSPENILETEYQMSQLDTPGPCGLALGHLS